MMYNKDIVVSLIYIYQRRRPVMLRQEASLNCRI